MMQAKRSVMAAMFAVLVTACTSSDKTIAGSGGSPGTGGAPTDATGGTIGSGGAIASSGGSPASTSTSGGAGSKGGDTGGLAGITGAGAASAAGGAVAGGGRAGTGGAAGGSVQTGGTVGAGTCANGSSVVFPTISSYTAKDGGFGPATVTRRTGDATLGSNTVAIFRPAATKYGQGGVRHPVIVWGNGHTNTVDIWAGFLGRVATYGFVVVAPEQTEVTADQMNQALDYVVRLATDSNSGDCGKIDVTKLGSSGYSLGGMGAITVGSNARITSTFIFASNGNVKNLKAPWGIIGGDADTTFNWTAISTAVTGSTQPAFGAALAGIDHNGVAGQAKAQEAYIAWMRWRFMGDQLGHDVFVGPNCQICKDAAFSGTVKTTTFDSL